MNSSYRSISTRTFTLICLLLLILRLWIGAITPLTETTEARYGEIARKMLETGNWVNLLNTYNSPFWAKPPLYAWLSAASMYFLGINEFALRLPSVIVSALSAFLVFITTKPELGKDKAAIATIILISSFGFFVASDTVMTDPTLLFAVTLGLCAWWKNHQENQPLWAYSFFVAIGLGMLAKGPLAIVLIGMPIFFYLLIHQEWKQFFAELPWIGGIFISLVAPGIWYVLAELKTPGFLEYFLLGEHIYRFIKPGWTGDLYGNAHTQTHGTIVLYALLALLPWSLVFIMRIIRPQKNLVKEIKTNRFKQFLTLWLVTQIIFFCLPANIIWPYYLPAAPAFAILCADQINWSPVTNKRIIFSSIGLTIALALLGTYMLKKYPENHLKSGKSVVEKYIEKSTKTPGELIYLSSKRLFSLEFYSSGKAQWIKSTNSLHDFLKNKKNFYLITSKEQFNELPSDIKSNFLIEDRYEKSALNLMLLIKNQTH
jgi:4-amino-4-deoxy-L-arabinose transferase-like glycosyltransferase